MMESVEDIPADSILDGLSWDWQTYGEYLGELDRLPKGVNVGGMVGHCAVRHWAMGERGLDDDARLRRRHRRDGPRWSTRRSRAGALGFSTSRTMLHRVPDGRAVPGHVRAARGAPRDRGRARSAPARHVRGRAPVRRGRRRRPRQRSRAEVDWMAEVNRATGRPVTFGLAQSRRPAPSSTPACSASSTRKRPRGAQLRPQTTARGIGILFGLVAPHAVRRPAVVAGAPAPRPRRPPRRARRRRHAAPADRATPTSARRASSRTGVSGRDGRRALRLHTRRQPRRASPQRAGESPAETFVRLHARERRAGRCSAARSSTSGFDAVDDDAPPPHR